MSDSQISKELHRRIFELTLALYRVTDFFPQGEVLRRQLREKAGEIFGGVTECAALDVSERGMMGVLARIETIKGYLSIARSMRFVRPINIVVLEREYDMLAGMIGRIMDQKKEHVSHEKEIPSVEQRIPTSHHDSSKNNDIEELSTWQEFSTDTNSGTRSVNSSTHPDSPVDRRSTSGVVYPHTKRGQVVEGDYTDEVSPRYGVGVNERQKAILEHLKQKQHVKISDLHVFLSNISSKTIQRDLQDLVNKNMLQKEGEKRWTVYSLKVNVL